jgi:hypothetical protein
VVEDGAAVIEIELAPCEFALLELSLPGTPSKERAEESTAGDLNDLLSYKPSSAAAAASNP